MATDPTPNFERARSPASGERPGSSDKTDKADDDTADEKDTKKPESTARPVGSGEKPSEKSSANRPSLSELLKPSKPAEKIVEDTPEDTEDEHRGDPEQLDTVELQAVADSYIELKIQEVDAQLEQVVEASVEEAEALADAVVLAAAQEAIDNGEDPQEALAAAVAGMTEELGLEEAPEVSSDSEVPDGTEEDPADTEDDDTDPAVTPAPLSAPTATPTSPVPPQPSPPPPPGPTPSQPPSPPPSNPGNLPPTGGGGVPPGRAPNFAAPSNPDVNRASAPNFRPASLEEIRRAQIRGVLAGGLVGYLIGRRRGRIKTEKRLLPVQEKLEKEVKQLHSVVEAQELKARELARQKYWAEWEDNRPKFVAGLREKVNAKTEARAEKRVVIVEQPEAPRTAPLAETVYPRSPKKPEGLGKMTMELTPERRRENRRELTHEVLLEMSENIEVNGTKLRQIYESGRLDDDGLKQVVLEHLRGGRYEMLLASREIITTERGAEVSADLLPADRRQARQPIIQGAAGPIPSNTATYTPGPAASPSRSPASMVARPFRSMTKQKRTVATAATVGVVSFALLAWLLVSLV